ncbi:MAG TPA: META domain-containing protein [Thiolinea sp.]|nr:META domain-containing protein [Thiolinea sp.]
MKKQLALITLAGLGMLAQPSFAAVSQNLNQTTWQLVSVPGWTGTTPDKIQPRATISFNGGVINGHDSCNNFRAAYSQPKVANTPQSLAIRMDGAMSTLMACPPQQTKLAGALSSALKKTYQYSINDKYLTLMDNRGAVVATFDRPATDVPGTSWQLLSFNNGTAMLSSLNTEHFTATFAADGTVSGFSGCNNYRATYKLDRARGTMRVGPVGSTFKLCPNEDLMKEEAGFLSAWQRVGLYGRQGNGLSLFDARGMRLMDFRYVGPAAAPKPVPAQPRPPVKPQPR